MLAAMYSLLIGCPSEHGGGPAAGTRRGVWAGWDFLGCGRGLAGTEDPGGVVASSRAALLDAGLVGDLRLGDGSLELADVVLHGPGALPDRVPDQQILDDRLRDRCNGLLVGQARDLGGVDHPDGLDQLRGQVDRDLQPGQGDVARRRRGGHGAGSDGDAGLQLGACSSSMVCCSSVIFTRWLSTISSAAAPSTESWPTWLPSRWATFCRS